MKPRNLAVGIVAFFILASRLGAFDNQRQGFVLGGGIGGGYFSGNPPGGDAVFAANLKIGSGLSNRTEVYYTYNASFYQDEGTLSASGIHGIGVTQYTKPEGYGLFFLGGVGLAFETEFEGGGSDYGFGGFIGLGHDIGKHWSIQADLSYMSVNSSNWAFRVTLNFTAF
jgi:hypothetical protein